MTKLNEEQVCLGLSLLGQIERSEVVRELMKKYNVNLAPKHVFVYIVRDLRIRKLSESHAENIVEAFEALYNGLYPRGDNMDGSGRKYLFADDLRKLLSSQGEKFTDEEADDFIRECHPILDDNTGRNLIYFEQYRAVLLDKAA